MNKNNKLFLLYRGRKQYRIEPFRAYVNYFSSEIMLKIVFIEKIAYVLNFLNTGHNEYYVPWSLTSKGS